MNPQSDLTRFMAYLNAMFIILFSLICFIIVFSIVPIQGQHMILPGAGLFLGACLLIVVLLGVYTKQILKHVFYSKIDFENALKASEKTHRSMIENIPIGFARTTPGDHGRFVEVNTFFANMLGYSKAEIIQMPVSGLYADKENRKLFSDKICKHELVKDEQVLLRKKNGTVITIHVTGQAVKDDNGAIHFFDLILDDVTHEKIQEQEALKNEKLSCIGILAGGIAHDFNNILTGLYGNIALAKLELDPNTEAAQLIGDAEQSMSKATDLTQQLLIFAKGGDPIKKTITIDQAIKDTARFNLSGSNIKLVTEFEKMLWPVHADKGQISQVISNLVINARQAMPDGGILKIKGQNKVFDNQKTTAFPLDGHYVKITIKDQGTGIPEDCLSKIFDPYFTTKHSGSGMGLAISFSIIKKHNGWITAASEPGEGTAIVFFLPADLSAEEEHLPTKDKGTPRVTSARILIMDDDEQVCNIAQKMISKIGFQTSVVHDGSDALTVYKQAIKENNPFDLVLMDLTIPGGMGGKDAIVKMLDIDPTVKAIVVSGYSNDPVLANYTEYGFKGMLVKPFTLSALKDRLDLILNNPTLEN